jgi:hypothetical protein
LLRQLLFPLSPDDRPLRLFSHIDQPLDFVYQPAVTSMKTEGECQAMPKPDKPTLEE